MIDLHAPILGKGIMIAFPESTEPRTLKAIRILADKDLIKPVLIGNDIELRAVAKTVGISLDGIEIVEHDPDRFAQELADLRKEKGLSVQDAKELLKDAMYFATMLLHNNLVAGVVSGAVHPTSHTLRPALQIIKTRPGVARWPCCGSWKSRDSP